jgi:acetolactate synthase-1/2/3 large subunit
MNAAELLMRHLEAEGVKYLFGVPGAPLMPIFHATYHPDSRIKAIISKHEEGGAFMADGYSRVSGHIGVCCGTSGPGTTNLITGIAASYMDSIPLLVLTAQVATSTFGKGAIQECTGEDRSFATSEVLKAFTKSSVMVLSPDNISFFIKKTLRTALLPRMGPVHLNLPPDIMRKEVGNIDPLLETFRVETSYFDRDKIKLAAQALLKSRRPTFFLGFGCILSQASQEVRDIAELLNIPVITTPKAKGAFSEDHPLSLGPFGLAGCPTASEWLLNRHSDCLLAIGTSFNEWATNGWDPRLKGDKLLLQIDIDPTQIGKNYPTNIGMVGDAKTVLRELWFELQREIKRTGFLLERSLDQAEEFKRTYPWIPDPTNLISPAKPILPQRLIHDIRSVVPRDGIFFIDAGNNTLWAIHYLQIYEPGTFQLALSYGPMGYSIPAAIGGKLAAPDRPVIAICGDGGFLMHGMEVSTAVQYDIPAIWIIMNDSRLNMIYQAESLQNRPGLDRYEFKPTDFSLVAKGLGALGFRVERPEDIVPTLQEALNSKRPCVLDVVIDRDELSPIKDRIRSLQKFMKA